MFDMSYLTTLSKALEQSVIDKNIEEIQRLCQINDGFIRAIEPLENDKQGNECIEHFIAVHQSATRLIRDVHLEMQKQLYQTNKTRKSVNKYKGVKNAE